MRSLIWLTLALPLPALALSIQREEPATSSYSAALKECEELGHGKACSRTLQKGDLIETPTFETCLTFKGEENESNVTIDDTRSQIELAPRGFSRYGSCLKAVKNRSFNEKAVSVCSVMNDFIQHLECLDAIAGKAFHAPTVDACLKITYGSAAQGIDCLRAMEGRALSANQLTDCEKSPLPKRLQCLRVGSSDDLAACQQRLSDVELKVEAFQANSSNRSVKRGIQPILDAIRRSPGQKDVK